MALVHYADHRQLAREASHIEKRFILEIPNEHSLADVLRPDYWKNVSANIKRLSVVTVIGGKDNIDVDLRCVSVGHGYCMMKVIRQAPTAETAVQSETVLGAPHIDYIPGYKWCIIDRDESILKENFGTRESAQGELDKLSAAA